MTELTLGQLDLLNRLDPCGLVNINLDIMFMDSYPQSKGDFYVNLNVFGLGFVCLRLE